MFLSRQLEKRKGEKQAVGEEEVEKKKKEERRAGQVGSRAPIGKENSVKFSFVKRRGPRG